MSEIKPTYSFSGEPTGTHLLIANEVSEGSTVLDVGCASGYLGHYLVMNKRCRVWGIEPDAASFTEAQDKGYEIIVPMGVEDGLADSRIRQLKFDYIIAADILEHLVDPESALKKLRDQLAADGKIIVSLPNVAHYSIRWLLLWGKWEMQDGGILDRTHLKFYTFKTAQLLLEKGGWSFTSMRPRGDLERWFRRINCESLGKRLLFFWPEFFAIQFIFVAIKS